MLALLALLLLLSGASAFINVTVDPDPTTAVIGNDWYASVVHDGHRSYKLYTSNSSTAFYLETSTDGIAWGAPVLLPTLSFEGGSYCYDATFKHYRNAFAGADFGTLPNASARMHYRMWAFCDDTYYYAESADGVAWANLMPVAFYGTPIVQTLNEEVYIQGPMDVVYVPNDPDGLYFYIYFVYEGMVYLSTGEVCNNLTCVGAEQHWMVGLAFSANGYNWTGYIPDPLVYNYTQPIFKGRFGQLYAYDETDIYKFAVVRHSATNWEAFYSGSTYIEGEMIIRQGIGHAVSADGFGWTRDQALILFDNTSIPWLSDYNNYEGFLYLSSVDYQQCNNIQLWYMGALFQGEGSLVLVLGDADMGHEGCKLAAGTIAAIVLSVVIMAGAIVITVVALSLTDEKTRKKKLR